MVGDSFYKNIKNYVLLKLSYGAEYQTDSKISVLGTYLKRAIQVFGMCLRSRLFKNTIHNGSDAFKPHINC